MQKLFAVALCAVSFVAFAQGKGEAKKEEKMQAKEEKKEAKGEMKDAKADAKAAAPAMPTLPPEARKWLDGMRGNWKSDVEMTMGDKTMKGKMTMNCAKDAADWATTCKGKFDFGKEMPKAEGVFIYGWDLGTGQATMYEVTSMAEVHAHVGKWADDKTITVTHTGKNAEGKDEVDALTFTWNSPKELTMKAEGTQGGKVVWTMAGVAKK